MTRPTSKAKCAR